MTKVWRGEPLRGGGRRARGGGEGTARGVAGMAMFSASANGCVGGELQVPKLSRQERLSHAAGEGGECVRQRRLCRGQKRCAARGA